MERAWPRFLRGRRGFVHPALLHLRRRGAVVARWAGSARGERRVYAAAGSVDGAAQDAAEPERGPGREVPPSLGQLARKTVRGLAFAPRLADDVHRDVEDHLADAFAALRDAGTPEDEALREVTRDFGDAWRIRTETRKPDFSARPTARGLPLWVYKRTTRSPNSRNRNRKIVSWASYAMPVPQNGRAMAIPSITANRGSRSVYKIVPTSSPVAFSSIT